MGTQACTASQLPRCFRVPGRDEPSRTRSVLLAGGDIPGRWEPSLGHPRGRRRAWAGEGHVPCWAVLSEPVQGGGCACAAAAAVSRPPSCLSSHPPGGRAPPSWIPPSFKAQLSPTSKAPFPTLQLSPPGPSSEPFPNSQPGPQRSALWGCLDSFDILMEHWQDPELGRPWLRASSLEPIRLLSPMRTGAWCVLFPFPSPA